MDNKNNTKSTFKHRLDETKANDLRHVSDSIGLITERAEAVLHLLFEQLGDGASQINNLLLQGAISSVIADIHDIDCILGAHYEAVHKTGGEA